MPTAKKKPTNIRLNSITPTLVHMDFDPPEVPYEHISAYIIEYGGRRTNVSLSSILLFKIPHYIILFNSHF